MRRFWSLVSLYVAVVHAEDFRGNARTPLRFIPKGTVGYTNSTILYQNTTTSPTESPSFPTSSDDAITHSITSTPHTVIGIYTNTSTTLPETTTNNTTDDTPSCTGSITYYGSVPPTVYVTVTEGFDVTVTASNVSITDTPTLITPLPYCQQTIMPGAGPVAPDASFVSASFAASSPPAVAKSSGNLPFLSLSKGPPAPAPPEPTETTALAGSSVYASVPYTSTVIITKKTPVTVVAPPTSSPDINFHPTPPSSRPPSGPSSVNANASGGKNDGNPGNNGSGNHNGNDANPLSPGGVGASPTKSTVTTFPSLTNTAGPTPGTLVVPSTTRSGIGNIIASIIYSPFATRLPTGRPAFAPTTTTVDNIPIVVSESRVIIGTQTVDVPRSSSTVVHAGGDDFTVRPSIIVAPTATITLTPVQQHDASTVSPATTTFTTAIGDLTITVGPTVAIISGTTYRIGDNAPATTISVHGTKVSIGSEGIGLPSTTIVPGGASFVVVTAEGLTFSLDESEAIFSGTTYRIGSNAPQVTTTVATDSISFGPGGIGLKSTTILPTAAPHPTVQTSEPSVTSARGAAASESASADSAASSRFKPLDIIFSWNALAILLCLFV
ncbi:uncharacterized protein PV06_08859 [Exophiala oligosperma]|uniref:Uncharacterized protein n=2 Tax=Chaetothyriales TaxID=34395 RepID=A0A0D2D7E5_9EURO|nr:uncharacterized protein PV06_08859 [Exophiala oligosperma]KAJ9635719.1 hypothetical protein H2204_005679 [Knufia peltigerae]KIW39043.1 hypothetical protein PV06_08859 [Exophiala oligosperma]